MGWDVVQIGLKHDLPVDDPIATAELVAKRMNRNIKLVYYNEIEYDKINNIVSEVENFEYIEIARITIDNSTDYLQMEVLNYQASQILKETNINTLRKAKTTSDWARDWLDDIEKQYALYEISGEHLFIKIGRENICLDVNIIERWWGWEELFHPMYFDRDKLLDYRMKIFDQARMFGCMEVIIFSDQGPTELILDHINSSVEYLKQYVNSNQYTDQYYKMTEQYYRENGQYDEFTEWYKPEKIESMKKHAKKITFSSVFQDDFKLEGEDFVEIVYDDFKDLI